MLNRKIVFLKLFRPLAISWIALFLLPFSLAYAACADPVGNAGEREYFTDEHTYKFCDGTDWIDLSGGGVGASDTHWSSVELLLHGDPLNGPTTFTDSSAAPHTLTRNGDTVISTSQSKFGGASIYFDGAGDYLSTPDSDDFDLSAGDWTIEFWVRLDTLTNGYANYQAMIGQFQDDNNRWNIRYGGTEDNLTFAGRFGGNLVYYVIPAQSLSANTWYHIAVVRNGANVTTYLDGVSQGSATNAASITNITGNINIGRGNFSGGNFDTKGYIDDFRFTKGVARYTADFTPPTEAFPDN